MTQELTEEKESELVVNGSYVCSKYSAIAVIIKAATLLGLNLNLNLNVRVWNGRTDAFAQQQRQSHQSIDSVDCSPNAATHRRGRSKEHSE